MPVTPENDPLYRLRHSTAHVMAQAVLELFPEAKIAIGPPVENGFYYDFDLPRPLTPDDLEEIERRMRRIVQGNHPFVRRVVTPDEARELFKDQPYKLELIEDLLRGANEYGEMESGTAGAQEQGGQVVITTYRQDSFEDLCRGPHVANTREIKPDAFKLLRVSGAYWRGDERRPQLQRIYGTVWPSKRELEEYLHRLEEAKKRDHRVLGKQLGLFHFSEEIGPGIPLLTPKGALMRHLMEEYVRETQTRYGYEHVWTGHLVKESLYAKSGHLENYAESMFPPMVEDAEHGQIYRLKPMNCPSHMTLYNEMGLHSYRELPLRFAEFCTLYRFEKTGELTGLTRVRALTQDDCHIFCTPAQIESEFGLALQLINEVFNTYGFHDYYVRLSLRGSEGKYVADDEKWEQATAALKAALEANAVQYVTAEGEAAFYGPKADFIARDVLGREWQLSTIQVDFIQPARLGCEYIGEDGQRHTPVVLHRAVTGSWERFFGILIEHYAGAFPVWLAPVQAMIIPITDRHVPYARQVAQQLKAAGIRAQIDLGDSRMNAKIRDAQLQKIPYMLVVGDKEMEAGTVAVRLRTNENRGPLPLDGFIAHVQELIRTKSKEL
ncbi:threonine--tRNA ligase [Kallotenue papyrolyticum]|uniref:threonine--tRNA ligase n=1 Tax=Kallotenue papyrolyticum TaxID=1325125 RepID=UPI0004786192|nr:threonine--tRNA ligase [Kallotenue papyrolyticum]